MECVRVLRDHGAKEIFGLAQVETPFFISQYIKINKNLI
jgi:hypothetical protein